MSTHTDAPKLLEDADYIIICILIGGYEAIRPEIDIPMKYGIDQCIGDTLTPGGAMCCLRTLPTLREMAHDITRICPEAFFLQHEHNGKNMLPEIRKIAL